MNLENKKETICAVVVTYNRKDLLLECLEAIRKQTRPIDAICIIDNASYDGTPEALKKTGYISELPPSKLLGPYEVSFEVRNLVNGNPIKIFYVRMPKNTGGAGGFYEGVKKGYEKKYEWLWLLDDDTLATPTALSELLKIKKIIDSRRIGFICSKVLWTDKKIHHMNIPEIKRLIRGRAFNEYEDRGFLLVESASFVSLLIPRKVIKKVGYPIKEFFIWADDVEYTRRISRFFEGFYCNKSVVIHKTKRNYSAKDICDWRLYYYIRNNLYILKKENRKKFLYFWWKYLLMTFLLPVKFWKISIRACIDIWFFNPTIIYPGE